jgi:phosphotransferase system enzyme I (PtsP)
MLDTLRQIAEEVGNTANLQEALGLIVGWVKQTMHAGACSVYLRDPGHEDFVLMATDGLRPESVLKVRLAPGEGLVGIVAQRHEPLLLRAAAGHPAFRYFPETGEERYTSFLGVPIIYFRQVLGVLVVQHQENPELGDSDIAFLVTIASQLAGAIHEAATVGDDNTETRRTLSDTPRYLGAAGAPGVGIGTLLTPSPYADLDTVPDRDGRDPETEEAAFREAVVAVEEELRKGSERMAGLLPKEVRDLFDVYALFISDSQLIDDIVARIREGKWAATALRAAIEERTAVFAQMHDPYLRQRGEDIRAVARRILFHLHSDTREPRNYPERCILAGDEVSLARIADVPPGRLAGIVCRHGSTMSHIALIARSLGIPAIMGAHDFPVKRLQGHMVVVDGYGGRVLVDPPPSVRSEFERLAREEEQLASSLAELRDLPAQTPDGVQIPLYANAGLASDIALGQKNGAAGVGLYRTEFPFMLRASFPGEEAQYRLYRRVLEACDPLPVTMRTLDIGSDKGLPYFPIKEENAALGWRGIRVTLDHPEIFLTQLRAMLRANAGLGNLRLLFPMVSRLDEIKAATALLEQACEGLKTEGKAREKPPLGVMIEVPAAVYCARHMAQYVDFFSLGTNDLTQYLLAIDRDNEHVAERYDHLHPAVLQCIRDAIDGAHAAGKPIGACGEMAADPLGAVLLLGMGIGSLSMAAPSIPHIKWVIRNFTFEQARELLDRALELAEASAIRPLLTTALEHAGLGGLIRAGR